MQGWLGPSSTKKTAPFLCRKVGKYTSHFDQGNIVVVLGVIRTSLRNRIETGDSWENGQGKDQLLQADRTCSRFHQG
jgi:hypothetical protein